MFILQAIGYTISVKVPLIWVSPCSIGSIGPLILVLTQVQKKQYSREEESAPSQCSR